MEDHEHIVDFYKYCPTCQFYEKEDTEDPCYECLTVPARMNSRKPERWVKADERTIKRRSTKRNQ